MSGAARFDGWVGRERLCPPAAARLEQRGTLSLLERQLADYLDEATRQEMLIEEWTGRTERFAAHNLNVARARYDSSVRNIRWAIEAVNQQRAALGMAAHPVTLAQGGGFWS